MDAQSAINLLLLGKSGNGKTSTVAKLIDNQTITSDPQNSENEKYDDNDPTRLDTDQPTPLSFGHKDMQTSDEKISGQRFGQRHEYTLDDTPTTRVVLAGTATLGGNQLNIIDSPGLFDTSDKDYVQATETTIQNIKQAIGISKTGINAFGLVLVYGSRVSHVDQMLIQDLKTLFGGTFFKDHVIVIFTHGDDYKIRAKGAPFKNWLAKQQGELRQLIDMVTADRCLLFENERGTPESEEEQKRELFNVLSNMTKPYTSQDFDKRDKGRGKVMEKAQVRNRSLKFETDKNDLLREYLSINKLPKGPKKVLKLQAFQAKFDRLLDEAHPDDRKALLEELDSLNATCQNILERR